MFGSEKQEYPQRPSQTSILSPQRADRELELTSQETTSSRRIVISLSWASSKVRGSCFQQEAKLVGLLDCKSLAGSRDSRDFLIETMFSSIFVLRLSFSGEINRWRIEHLHVCNKCTNLFQFRSLLNCAQRFARDSHRGTFLCGESCLTLQLLLHSRQGGSRYAGVIVRNRPIPI